MTTVSKQHLQYRYEEALKLAEGSDNNGRTWEEIPNTEKIAWELMSNHLNEVISAHGKGVQQEMHAWILRFLFNR